MPKVKVTILPGGMTAKEVNPFGEEPEKFPKGYWVACDEWKNWKQNEDKCRMFTIDKEYIKGGSISFCEVVTHEEGQTHEAEIIDEEKLIIKIL